MPSNGHITHCDVNHTTENNLLFSEYFDGDNGAASALRIKPAGPELVADLVRRKYGAVRSTGEVIAEIASHPSPNMRP